MMQESFHYLSSPGKSSGDDQSATPIVVDNQRNAYAFDGPDSEKYMHTPRGDEEAPTLNSTAATLSPQSQPSPPETPPQARKASITPILERGRVLQDDEIAGNFGDSRKYPKIPLRSPPREYRSAPAANDQSFSRFQPGHLLSPNVMTQHPATMIHPAFSYSESPDVNLLSSIMDGSNHEPNDATAEVPVSMLWGNDMGGVRHPGEKPKRPLSAYNFYFQLERERIINSNDEDRDATVIYTVDDVARLTLTQQRKAKENKPKEKRSHRKTHGKISFGDLARTIANKWKQLDKSDKEIFEGSASIEKERYRKELGEWNKQMKKWKDAAAKVASTLQFTQKGGLSSTSNHSHQDLNTSSHSSFHNGNHMVTPEVPKRAVYQGGDMHSNETSMADHHMIQALANQQRAMNGPIGNGSLSNRSVSSHMGKSQRGMASSSVLPAVSNMGNRFNDVRPSFLQQGNNGRNNGIGLGMLDYGDEMGQAFGSNEVVPEEDYYMNEGFPNMGGGNLNNNYDYDDVTDDTYRMAQMMLPPQSALSQRNMSINGQQRRLINQRRMKMLMMMQQKYNRDQMLMMQMGQFNGSANGLGFVDGGDNYGAAMDESQQLYIDQVDDSASYLDHSSAASHLMMNPATAAAAAAFGRSQQHRHLFQQHQNRLVDELTDNQNAGMDDQYHQRAHMLHNETFDERV